jgi:hypothetical protein
MIHKRLNKLLDGYALVAAMIADIGILLVCFIVVSPGIIEAIGMGILSFVVVLFAVRAWLKGGFMGKAVWAMFALVAFFFDLSFVLVSTDVQSQSAKTVDTELVRMQSASSRALDGLTNAQTRYDDALNRGNSRATLDSIKATLDAAQATYDKAEIAYQERLRLTEAQADSHRVPLTADNLSTAIWDAATSGKPGRIAFLVAFGLLFIGLQLTMVTAAEGTKKEPDPAQSHVDKPKRTRTVKQKNNDRLTDIVAKLYYNTKRADGNNRVLKWGSMNYYLKGALPKDEYKVYLAKLQAAGIVSDEGVILELDESKALEVLQR